jgi:tetratricopeptide (TPR) repeat protein
MQIRELALHALNKKLEELRQAGKFVEAIPLAQRVRARSPTTATLRHRSTALLYDNQGRYADAEPLYKRALAIREKTLGPDHPDVAQSLNNLASLYDHQGRYADAEPLSKRSLAIREKALGPDHRGVATSLNNLALLYDHQGHYADAESLYKRALAIREKTLGPDHPDVAQSLNNLALLYDQQGRYADAEPLYKRALYKPGAEALSGLASALFYAEARALLVSHWSVDSEAATRLTTSTFAIMKADPKLGRAEALRNAMLAYMNDKSSPLNAYPAF